MDESSVRSKMQSSLDVVASDIAGIRTGRATPALVENIVCPAYGGTQRLRVLELATITAPDPSQIIISPWDKSIIGDIKKGIMEANVGMNPSVDGEILRIAMAPLTTEDREKYIKLLSSKLENGKVVIRQVRADEMHEIKKKFEAKEMTEDEKFGSEKRLQEITDEYVGRIEEMGEKKKAELLQI
ncbi:MAG: Ribosome-recycling factor [Microgenomates group bacterium GW2011_GWC1_43_13]|uniref:Ribosome-recycling factor n=3 Tax=Candidatus Woeseibacteriota TaxID=1752722 RepID=A0A837I989_9BACT|nr:MAG: Ribosome-recycling factor [Microgenomates group bacterium GW2011_GWC1_43_13]KKT33233.1 MAG: Ribosome-recycling factor [Candidatus Woesebacteria bacterium GW2011_GWB1_44_11]KKT54365.1 MAG: Ribosome-recycling factor [Candidatus Woesebacteria bacterium GW2011_GWA1_44_23]OGM76606.1 MAG: ribosome recycling factor [Candidatus Woesebacteria bacterium RIFOXYA1_FULL_43_16]OGM82622.1 MAG: ribosome recycling factor [Candidatus Woesebacteria bacterium RIFOXYB1_FULL_42_36]OGM84756.1 MAG: ribosome r